MTDRGPVLLIPVQVADSKMSKVTSEEFYKLSSVSSNKRSEGIQQILEVDSILSKLQDNNDETENKVPPVPNFKEAVIVNIPNFLTPPESHKSREQ